MTLPTLTQTTDSVLTLRRGRSPPASTDATDWWRTSGWTTANFADGNFASA